MSFPISDLKATDPHPWLTDLRSLARMLEGKVKLPHVSIRQVKLAGHKIPGKVRIDSRCTVCLDAYDRRENYKKTIEA
jgi:hypothetical protein